MSSPSTDPTDEEKRRIGPLDTVMALAAVIVAVVIAFFTEPRIGVLVGAAFLMLAIGLRWLIKKLRT